MTDPIKALVAKLRERTLMLAAHKDVSASAEVSAVADELEALAVAGEDGAVGEVIDVGYVGVRFYENCNYGCGLPVGTKIYLAAPTQQAAGVVEVDVESYLHALDMLWRAVAATNYPLYRRFADFMPADADEIAGAPASGEVGK